MLLTILVFIGFFISGIVAAIHKHDRDYFWWISIVVSTVGSALTLMITVLIGTAIPSNEIIYKETVTPIVALEDNAASRGKFFLGIRASNSDIYYYCMIDTERGYVIKNVKARDAYIKYDTNPRIVIKSGRGFNHWYNYIWAFPPSVHYTIYVPEGTILNNITLI